jgi:hypothetical protein
MVEGAALLSFYLAFALVYGADSRRFPARRYKPTRGLLHAMRAGALAALVTGVALWTWTQSLAAALLVALTALSIAATLFVLLAPLAPRALWSLAFACPLLVVVLTVTGASHG